MQVAISLRLVFLKTGQHYLRHSSPRPSLKCRFGCLSSGFDLLVTIAIPIHRSLHTPEPRNLQKVSERSSPGLPARSVNKASQKAPNPFFFGPFALFRHFFDTLGRETQG